MAYESAQKCAEICAPFEWNGEREEAAVLLAEDQLSDQKIADKLNICRRTLQKWKSHPDFRERINENAKRIGNVALGRAIAKRGRRVAWLDQRHAKLRRVVLERAADPLMANVPGGKTGLIVRQIKGIGKGDDFQIVEEFFVDTGLLDALLKLEKQAGVELEQIAHIQQHQGRHGGPIEHQHEHQHEQKLTVEERRACLLTILDSLREQAARAEGDSAPDGSEGLLAGSLAYGPGADPGGAQMAESKSGDTCWSGQAQRLPSDDLMALPVGERPEGQ